MSTPKNTTRVPVSPTLADSLSRGEASARAEGVDVLANPAYQDVKRKMLAGEIDAAEAEQLLFEGYGVRDKRD
jgi:hypothetical protein